MTKLDDAKKKRIDELHKQGLPIHLIKKRLNVSTPMVKGVIDPVWKEKQRERYRLKAEKERTNDKGRKARAAEG